MACLDDLRELEDLARALQALNRDDEIKIDWAPAPEVTRRAYAPRPLTARTTPEHVEVEVICAPEPRRLPAPYRLAVPPKTQPALTRKDVR